MEPTKHQKAIREACRIVGGQAVLARLLGVSPPTVNQWVSGARQVPAERCPAIEKATGGAVTCEELRPDVDWAYLRGSGAAANNETTGSEAAA
ncbi:transcriptional regulator [Pandoraea apista]|uniref:transcriptional regulator n=1 Tax=Pandoraea apista TaxID=93218 RepID=UPI00058A9D6D|nr:helix-turn-helix domain-containing protein [Pandoraea apista]AJE99619.1 Cro/Cl family transcriptional regulator [Pandoraea apista]AKH73741.1 Cro/Cl family transcriptional regulator [Pandoraea apista]AKI62289.1 Cro/Cl family transcriptional regulator [Pandoraea apista]